MRQIAELEAKFHFHGVIDVSELDALPLMQLIRDDGIVKMQQALCFALVHRYTNKADADAMRDKYRDVYDSVSLKSAHLAVAGLLVEKQLFHLCWSQDVVNHLWTIKDCARSLRELDKNKCSLSSARALETWLGSLIPGEAKGVSKARLMKMIAQVSLPM
jgi:hypothetical protein